MSASLPLAVRPSHPPASSRIFPGHPPLEASDPELPDRKAEGAEETFTIMESFDLELFMHKLFGAGSSSLKSPTSRPNPAFEFASGQLCSLRCSYEQRFQIRPLLFATTGCPTACDGELKIIGIELVHRRIIFYPPRSKPRRGGRWSPRGRSSPSSGSRPPQAPDVSPCSLSS